MPKPAPPAHQIPDPRQRPPELQNWQRAGLEADLALIEAAIAAIEAANEATREACYRVAMAETRHCVKGITRLPINLVTTRLLTAARDAAQARLAGRPVPALADSGFGRGNKRPTSKARAATSRPRASASQPEAAS